MCLFFSIYWPIYAPYLVNYSSHSITFKHVFTNIALHCQALTETTYLDFYLTHSMKVKKGLQFVFNMCILTWFEILYKHAR